MMNIIKYPETTLHLPPIKPSLIHTHSIIPYFQSPIIFPTTLTALANFNLPLADATNESAVLALYHALTSRNVQLVTKLLAPDLEWWFHGPPSHQHMMRLLTGTDNNLSDSFIFVPQSVDAFGSTVIVEGYDSKREVTWIHAWTVNSQGVITQVREYFNTSLTVTRFVKSVKPVSVTSSSLLHCPSVWESSLSNLVGKSVPGLVLAI